MSRACPEQLRRFRDLPSRCSAMPAPSFSASGLALQLLLLLRRQLRGSWPRQPGHAGSPTAAQPQRHHRPAIRCAPSIGVPPRPSG